MILCDNLVHMNFSGSTGSPLTTALLNSGNFGSATGWFIQCSDTGVNACSAMAPSSGPLHAPLDDFLVNNTQFRPTDTYRAISFDHAFSFSDFMHDTTVTANTYRMTWAGWITFGAPDAGVSGTLQDVIRFTTLSAGAYAILQLNNGNNPGYGVNIESLQSGGVLHSDQRITITPGSTYWCCLMIDCYNGITRAYLFDTSGNLFGSMKGHCTKTGASDQVSECRIGNSEAMTGTGTSYFEDMLLDTTRGQFVIPAKYGVGYKKVSLSRR